MPGQDVSKLKLGPIGDYVMFENDRVRVWDFKVEPGKSKGWHRHELPYVIIPMTDGEIELESALTGEIARPKGKIGEPILPFGRAISPVNADSSSISPSVIGMIT